MGRSRRPLKENKERGKQMKREVPEYILTRRLMLSLTQVLFALAIQSQVSCFLVLHTHRVASL